MTDPTPTRDEAVLPSEITEAQINSACLSYRHDFGLLDDHDKERLRFVAKEWLHAWRKEFDPMAPALKISASAPAPASGGVDAVFTVASNLLRDGCTYADRKAAADFIRSALSPAATPEVALCEDEGCPHHGRPHICTPVTAEMVTAAMRAFEPLSTVLRYREKDGWHACDQMAMRAAIEAALAAKTEKSNGCA